MMRPCKAALVRAFVAYDQNTSHESRDLAGDAVAAELLAYLVHKDDEGCADRSGRRFA